MSQNSSDILCLKEPKIGENDGSQIFSIKGTCSSKISRHHQASSDVFFYGLSQVSDGNPMNYEPDPKSETDSKSADEEAAEVQNDEFGNEVEDETDFKSADGEETEVQNDEFGNEVEDEVDNKSGTGESSVSTSDMKRSFITGAGLEDEKCTSRKHYLRKDQTDEENEEADEQLEEVSNKSGTGEPSVTTSNMKRNILTGAGLEDEKHTSRRHYATKSEDFW